jgi:hypothetical protein
MRTPWIMTAAALVASTLPAGLIASAAPASAIGIGWCDPVTPVPPCISSATVNGDDVNSSPDWKVSVSTYSVAGSDELAVDLVRREGDDSNYELGEDSLDDVVVIKMLIGSLVPRLVTGKARDTVVARAGSGSAHEVTVTGTPVIVSGQCDQSSWPWVCPEFSGTDPELDKEWVGIFNFTVSDYGSWDDAAQRESFYGMNYFNNVAATSVPPEIAAMGTSDPSLLIRLANRHLRSDGKTVVKGHGELRIPNAFLKEVYGIPDPATMTDSGLLPSLSGKGSGTVNAAQEAGSTAMLVTYDNVTFSARTLRIETGVITPTRPTQVSATRTAARRGFVDFDPSKARGAKVTGYAARCLAVRGDDVITAAADNIVRLEGLRKGVAYDCKVRATSKGGPSKWSEVVRMGAKVVS